MNLVLQPIDPLRRSDFPNWNVIGRIIRLDVDNWCSINGIETLHMQSCIFDTNQLYHYQPDRVGPLRSATSEHADNGRIRVSLWPVKPMCFVHFTQPENDIEVAKTL